MRSMNRIVVPEKPYLSSVGRMITDSHIRGQGCASLRPCRQSPIVGEGEQGAFHVAAIMVLTERVSKPSKIDHVRQVPQRSTHLKPLSGSPKSTN